MSTIFRTLQVNKWLLKNQTFLSFCEITATKYGSKSYNLHIIIYHYMTSYGYIIMIIVDSCMIWFDFDCIMQLKKSYHIDTNVCSRKSATTFGDLPDCLVCNQPDGVVDAGTLQLWMEIIGFDSLKQTRTQDCETLKIFTVIFHEHEGIFVSYIGCGLNLSLTLGVL